MLQIRLLGQFDIRVDGKRVSIPTRAAQSLFAFLVLTAGTVHRREKLAGQFWPDLPDENARRNLRQELWRIRKAISTQQSKDEEYLVADEFSLRFNREAPYWLDVSQMEKPDTSLQALIANLSLYQGELLPGFYDDWIALEREHVRSIFEARMQQLLDQLVLAERWIGVQEWAERWLMYSSTREPAYRALMLASGARGDMAKVNSIYERCVEDLRDQLGIEPSAETRALYEGLLKGAQASRRTTTMQPSGTVTFLFTDIQGSTRLLEKLKEKYAISLAEHHQILRTAIQKWNGTEMDTQGDAFFVTFARALDAIQCAIEAQQMLAAQSWPMDEPVRVRMGLHTGEPLITSTGYVGMDVHRAARIGDAGHGGQVLLSQTTRELVIHDLPPGIAIRDLGEHRLKDMKYPTPIYQLMIEGLQNDFPPLKMKFTGSEAPTPGEPPFKGLQFFDQTDADLFFGREVLTTKLIERLREACFLSVIIGASGSGKSSLVRAGIVPALRNGQLFNEKSNQPERQPNWQIHILTPNAHPLEALATEMTRHSESVTAAARFIDDLLQDPRSLSLYLSRYDHEQHTLLVLDQFEELFTLCRDEFEREAFIDNLLTALQQCRDNFTLILTLRADFYAHLAQYPELRDAVAQHQEYIGPMSIDELRHAIEEPAKRGHWEFEPGLVDLILRDVGDEPGALPLLSHALLETWKRRAGHTLTLKGYADAGGVHGAIAHTAESVYQNLSPEEQAITHDIFVRLTELGEGTEDTRRRASFEELMSHTENRDEVRNVLNQLADARLITLGEDTAEVAHEALIREWPTLREWLNQDHEGLRLHRHLTEAAYEWELLGRDAGALYRSAHLAQAREWGALHPNILNAGERAFLTASIEQEQHEEREREEQQQRELEAARKLAETEHARAKEQTQSANRLRIRNRVITIIGAVAVILALLAGLFGVQSNRNAVQAQSNFRRAEAQRLAAEANKLSLSQGSPELIALLSLRSMNTQYTSQGDGALVAASRLDYPQQLFVGHLGPIDSVAFSPDGKYILTGSNDKTAKLWNAQTGEEVRQFLGHAASVTHVAFSPDSYYISTSSWDKTTRLWNPKSGKEIQQFEGSNPSFSPDGKTVFTTNDNSVSQWDVTTGQKLQEFIVSKDTAIYSSSLSPNGRYLVAGDTAGIAHLWDTQTNQEIHRFVGHKSTVSTVIFSPDGKLILTGSYDTTARLWDTTTGKELQRYIGHTNNVNSVAFSADGRFVFTASSDDTARLWNAQTGEELRRFICPVGISSIAISPDGNSALTGSDDGVARLWNIKPRTELPSFINGSIVSGVAFSPDGKFVLTGGDGGIVRLWDAISGQKLHEFIGHTNSINYGVAFSPDGASILTGSWDGTVRLWDIQTGKELRRIIAATAFVNSVAFSPDGKHIVTGAGDGARLWSTNTSQEELRFSGVDQAIWRVAFSPDGKYVAIGADDGAKLFAISTGHLIRQFIGQTSVNSVAFSLDGKYLVTGGDKTARLWDIPTGQEVRQFIGHTDVIWTVSFSPDDKFIATASADGTARLWDVQTGQELRRFIGHTAGVENVVFSPDGKYILTGGDDGTAMLWDVDYHTTMKYLCSVLLRDFTDDERKQFEINDTKPTCPKT